MHKVKTIYSLLQRFTQEASWVVAGQVLAVLGTFVGIRILTEMLSFSEYGKVALIISFVNLVSLSFGRAIGTASFRFYGVSQDKGEMEHFKNKTFHYCKWFFVFCLSSLPILLLFWYHFKWNISLILMVEAVSFSSLLFLHSAATGLENAARKRDVAAMHQAGYEWGRTLLALMLLLVVSKTAEMVFFGFVIATLIVCISHYHFVRDKVHIHVRERTDAPENAYVNRYYSKYLFPVLISGCFTWIYMFSPRWILARLGSLEDVAVYSAFYQIGVAPALLGTSVLISFFSPIFYKLVSDGSNEEVHKRVFHYNFFIAAAIFLIVVLGALLTSFLKDFLCQLVLDKNYHSFAWILPWMILAGGLYAIGEQLLISVLSFETSEKLIPLKAGMAILAVFVYWVGCSLAGIQGIVYASVIMGGGYTLWILLILVGLYDRKLHK